MPALHRDSRIMPRLGVGCLSAECHTERTLCQMFCLSFGACQRLLFKRVDVKHAAQCSERRDWHVLAELRAELSWQAGNRARN